MNYSDEKYEDDRMKKQNYLKTHILNNPKYDADEFVLYMENAKPDIEGGEIDNWDFDELVEKVQEFKAQKEQIQGNKFNGALLLLIKEIFEC